MFSGPHQVPFVCKTEPGRPRRAARGQPGRRRACARPDAAERGDADDRLEPELLRSTASSTTVYRTTGGAVRAAAGRRPLPGRPGATTTTLDGRTVDYVVRRERGTINRFIYSIAMLAPLGDPAARARHLALERPPDLHASTAAWRSATTRGRPAAAAASTTSASRKGYAIVALERHAHEHALQPRARRRDRAHDEGALRRAATAFRSTRSASAARAARSSSTSTAQNHPGGCIDAGDPAVLVPRHGHADDPRRRLRAARALHGRHRRSEPEVADAGTNRDLARGHERRARRVPNPYRGGAPGNTRVRQRLARPDAARAEPAVRHRRRGRGAL